MLNTETTLRFLIDKVKACPKPGKARPCPLSLYRAMEALVCSEALSEIDCDEKRHLVRHCTDCLYLYG